MKNDLDMFTCPNLSGHLRLTRAACAKSWLRARSAARSDGYYACRNCSIGALNAHRPGVATHHRTPANLCVRCHRENLRLVEHKLCISCYNRERELRIGKNRKGQYPTGHVPLIPITLMCGVDPNHVEMYTAQVSSVEEAVLRLERSHDRRIVFGWYGGAASA